MTTLGIRSHRLRWLLFGHRKWLLLGTLALLAVLFAPFENWRGKRAWQKVRQQLEMRGEKLNLPALQPKPIPGAQNRMTHPFVQRHFGKPAIPLGLPAPSYPGLPWGPYSLSDLRKLPREPVQYPPLSDLVDGSAQAEVVPLFVFDKATLPDALNTLFRVAQLKVTVPPDIGRDAFNRPVAVSLRIEKVTTIAAIEAVLASHQLAVERDAGPHGFRILRLPATTLSGLLVTLAPYELPLQEFDEALKRPLASLPQELDLDAETPMNNYVVLRTLAQGLAGRAKIFALLSQREAALREIHRLRGVMDCATGYQPPTVVAAMVRTAIAGLLVETIHELLAAQLLSAEDCAAVQQELTGIDLLGPYAVSLRVERAATLDWLDRHRDDPGTCLSRARQLAGMNQIVKPAATASRTNAIALLALFQNFLDRLRPTESRADRFYAWLSPPGWVEQNKATLADWDQQAMDTLDAATGCVDARAFGQALAQTEADLERGSGPYTYLARILYANFRKALQTCGRNQTLVDEALVACALQRHHSDTGSFPAKLEALVPKYLPQIPYDRFDGKPLRYRLTETGFLLYSIGWNSRDDGGSLGGKVNWDYSTGDWVWRAGY